MQNKEIKTKVLAAIKKGIAQYEATISKNQAKEKLGLAKLEKTIGGADPRATGAGTDLPAGEGMSEVPNLMRGALPEGEGLADSEKDMTKTIMGDSAACAGCGSSKIFQLGTHKGSKHMICGDCGAVGSTPIQENTQAMKHQGVAKAELEKVTPPGEENLVHKLKDEYGHDKAGKEKAYATAWAIHNREVKEKSKKFKKEEMAPEKGTKPMCKEALKPQKEVPMTTTVVAQKIDGAKDGTEKAEEPNKAEGSGGKVEKRKYLGKGAMVDYIKARAAQAHVRPEGVMGIRNSKLPKPLPSVTPHPSPDFSHKGAVAKAESPAANPIAKSPSSKPAGTASVPKSTMSTTPKVPKL